MKIVKNTAGIESRILKTLICKVHAHMKKLERRAAPNWKDLRIAIGGRSHGYSGRAYYNGRARWKDWDVYLSLPPNATEHGTGSLVYHELMHTYGYKHSQYNEIPDSELAALFPEDKMIGSLIRAKPKPKAAPVEYGSFPIKVRMNTHSISELVYSETPSLEDWENDDRDPEAHPHGHTAEIAARHKTVLEIRSEGELEEIRSAIRWGMFNNYCPSAWDRLTGELDKHYTATKEAK